MSTMIMLSKQYNPKRLHFPVYVSEKLDGVAAEFYVPNDSVDEKVLVRSRQNKPILSVQHICDALTGILQAGDHVIGELYNPLSSFKDISGNVRSHTAQESLELNIYDCYREHEMKVVPFSTRLQSMLWFNWNKINYVTCTEQFGISTQVQLDAFIQKFFLLRPHSEGLMIRSHDHLYEPGKRSWGMMKLKHRETVDLEIVDIEEATDESGSPKGMAGGFKCKYNGSVIGVGPGKLTHAERVTVYANRASLIGTIVEVGYMPDPEYNSLREPTVLRLRDDKMEPNEEVQ